MTSIITPDGKVRTNGDAASWGTLRSLAFIIGLGGAVFAAGMSVGAKWDTAEKLDMHIEAAAKTYVRKDGRELEAIRGELRLVNEKLDMLLRKEGMVR